MIKKKQFTLHIMYPEPNLEPLKVILPKDGTHGLIIGEDWEVRQVFEMLKTYLENGTHDGQIADYHPQLGSKWLTAGEAETLAMEHGYSANLRTIRWAAAHGFIKGAEKRGRDWNIPQTKFLHWLSNRPKPGKKAGIQL